MKISNLRFPHLALGRLLLVFILLLLAVEAQYQHTRYHKFLKSLRSSAAYDPAEDSLSSDVVNYQGRDYEVRKSPDKYRMLILGGSAAEGHGQNFDQSWGGILQRKLQDRMGPKKKIEVINMAQGAATSIDDAVKFAKEGRLLRPDMVIVYSGWNDLAAFTGNPGWIVKNTESRLSEIGRNKEDYSLLEKLRYRSYWFKYGREMKERLERSISLFYGWLEAWRVSVWRFIKKYCVFPDETTAPYFKLKKQATDAFRSFSDVLREHSMDANYFDLYPRFQQEIRGLYEVHFRANLTLLAKLLKENHVKGVFIFQPDLASQAAHRPFNAQENVILRRLLGVRTDTWLKINQDCYSLGSQIMQKVSKDYGFTFINMDEKIRNYPAEEVFFDNVHYTEAGNRFIAEEVTENIQGLEPHSAT